ncbi:MAG: type II toxin-antitoxin system VapC family toxin [Thermoproteus sp.]
MERCVVDTSILISKKLDAVLQCRERYVTAVAVLEYLTWARRSAEAAEGPRRRGYLKLIELLPDLLTSLGLQLVDKIDIDDVRLAARWIVERQVNPGDALISATALRLNATVLTRDRDWERIPVRSVIVR